MTEIGSVKEDIYVKTRPISAAFCHFSQKLWEEGKIVENCGENNMT